MLRTMIDTLRFADRLKDSGFESCQAEGMARALGDALTGTVENLATKSDLDALDAKLSARIETLDNKVDALDAKMSARIEALDTKVGALGTQIRVVFAALALLLALGLVDTVPRLLS